jgi:hypothetical protein
MMEKRGLLESLRGQNGAMALLMKALDLEQADKKLGLGMGHRPLRRRLEVHHTLYAFDRVILSSMIMIADIVSSQVSPIGPLRHQIQVSMRNYSFI